MGGVSPLHRHEGAARRRGVGVGVALDPHADSLARAGPTSKSPFPEMDLLRRAGSAVPIRGAHRRSLASEDQPAASSQLGAAPGPSTTTIMICKW